MQKVKSSNIAEVGYAGGRLTVKFTSGATWSYSDVPERTYKEMMAAESIGSYFARNVRGFFKGTKHEA